MRQFVPYSDERLRGFCVFCGGLPNTRDHVPPKIFLDKPYPTNLPGVPSCLNCNGSASPDKEYIACLLEAVIVGSTDPSLVRRERIARTLTARPKIAAQLKRGLISGGYSFDDSDILRMRAVLDKTARALLAYETGEPTDRARSEVAFVPVISLDPDTLDTFYSRSGRPELFPEVGSRMLQRLFEDDDALASDMWIEVQADRFCYCVELLGEEYGARVKMVLSDYLAVEVDFELS